MARKPIKFTDEQRMTVAIMASVGFPHEQICGRIINPQTGKPITKETLYAHFREDLDNGKVTANAIVAQSLFKKATGSGPQSVTAAIFWLKTQAGWKPTEAVELTGKDGTPLPGVPQLSEEHLEKLSRKISKIAGELDKEY